MDQPFKEPLFDQNAVIQLSEDSSAAKRSIAKVMVGEADFQREQSKDELELVYATLRHSVNPTREVLEKEESSLEKEYFDTPLHDLASDMRVSVSRMVRESDFPRILKEMGFNYLGSVVTALCFSPSRMNTAIRKIARDKAHTLNYKIRSLDFNGYQFLRLSTVEAQEGILGKANTSFVKFLACIGSGIIARKECLLFDSENHSQPIPDIADKLPFMIVEMERRIQDNVKSYLRAASVTTKAAPNFIRSLVVAHNKVYSTVSPRKSSGATMGRMHCRVGGNNEKPSDGSSDGVTSVPRVNFFKVVNTSKSINDYGEEISRLVLTVSRIFLVTTLSLKIDGNKKQGVRNAARHSDAMTYACNDLKETFGDFLSLEKYAFLESAIASCLCSIGYCLHWEQSTLGRRNDSHLEGSSSTCDWNSETTSCRQKSIWAQSYAFSPCFHKSSRVGNKSIATASTSPEKEFQPLFGNFTQSRARTNGNSLSGCCEHIDNAQCKCNSTGCSSGCDPSSSTLPNSSSVRSFSPGLIGIHWILRALFLTESPERNTSDSLFLPTFMALASIADPVDDVKQRRFREAHQLTPTTAALAYGMKCCGVVEMCRDQQDWAIYSNTDVNKSPNVNGKCSEMIWLMSHEQVSRCFSTSHNTATAYLVGIHNKLRECADASSDFNVRFIECARPEHSAKKCALVDGKECSLDTIAKAVRTWQGKARNLMRDKLLLGMGYPDGFENMISVLNDNFHDTARGRSFASLDTHLNMTDKCAVAVMNHITKEERLYREFFGKRYKRDGNNVRNDTKPDVIQTEPIADDCGILGITAENSYDFQSRVMNLRSTATVKVRGVENIHMREKRLQNYLDDCQELQKLLLTCLHVTGGGTARSTEQLYLFKNSAESRRNVFVLQGEIAFIARYNKNESARGRADIIARFPDLETSKIFLMYFLYIRPLEEFFVQKLHGEEVSEAHGLYCFAEQGKPYSSDKVRAEIVKHFSTANIPFSYLEFRHYFAGIARKNLPRELLDTLMGELLEFCVLDRTPVHPVAGFIPQTPFETVERETVPNNSDDRCKSLSSTPSRARVPDLSSFYPIHEQAGHTLTTANKIYGLSSSEMNGLGKSKLEAFRLTSRAWQRALGLSGSYEKRKVSWNLDDGARKMAKVDELASEVTLKKTTESTSNENPEMRFARRSKEQERSLKYLSNGHEMAKEIKILWSTPNRGLPIHISPERVSMLLMYLRQIKKDRNATFRSMQQIYAIHLMLLRESDLFIIMPTGYGKTDMVLLTAFIEQSVDVVLGKTLLSVIIVPIIALSSDLIRRCESAGIRAGVWSQNRHLVDSLSILIVSVEHVETKEFSYMVAEQANKGRLGRVQMEECQTTANWIDFRPSYESLKGNIRPGGIQVPVVLVSATVPPHKTEELAEKHGVTEFHELRIPTVRTNLAYNVTKIETPLFASVEKHLCEKAFKTLESHFLFWTRNRHSGDHDTKTNRRLANEQEFRSVARTVDKDRVHRDADEEERDLESNRKMAYSLRHNANMQKGGQVIMYCPTLRIRSLLSQFLEQHRFEQGQVTVLGYDSSLTREEKAEVLRKWSIYCPTGRLQTSHLYESNRTGSHDSTRGPAFQVVVATCGFGMGIDSPFVRSVIHLGYSRSITEYVQESGRAGRDGNLASCELLFSPTLVQQEFEIITNSTSEKLELMRLDSRTSPNLDLMSRRRREVELLEFTQWAQNTLCCRRQSLYSYMDRTKPEMCLFYNSESRHTNISEGKRNYENAAGPITSQKDHSFCDFCKRIDETCLPVGSKPAQTRMREATLINEHSDVPVPIRNNTSKKAIKLDSVSPDLANNHFIVRTDLAKNHFIGNAMRDVSGRPANMSSTYPRQQETVPDRARVEKELISFKRVCIELRQICVVCMVEKGVKRSPEKCETNSQLCLKSRCYRCFQSSHNAKDCELIPFRRIVAGSRKFQPKDHERRNHCYACGMDTWLRVRMHHAAEFSRVDACPYMSAFRLAAVAWDSERWKKVIIERFELRRITGIDSPEQALQDVIFFKWLREKSSKKMQRLHLMEVLEFIMEEYNREGFQN